MQYNLADLSSFQRDALIRFLLVHMSSELRRELMHELPQVYNVITGVAVMEVRQARSDLPSPAVVTAHRDALVATAGARGK